MGVEDKLSLMEELALQKCAPSVRPVILISYNPGFEYSSKFFEVSLHLFIGPALRNLTHEESNVYRCTFFETVLFEQVLFFCGGVGHL